MPTIRTTGPLLAAALILSGCASMAPTLDTPEPSIPDAYPRYGSAPGDAPDATARAAAATGWRDYFADPALRQLIEQSLANNRDLRIAALRVEEARALYGVQRADQFPTLGAGADGSRARTPGDLNITGQPVIASQYQAGLNISPWELDLWGRVRSLRDAALENFLASEAARRAVATRLIADVANAYLGLRELDERLALARQTQDSRAESFRIFSRRVEVGSTSRLDLTQVETLLTQAQALVAQLEQARAGQLHALNVLVGQEIDWPLDDTGRGDAAIMAGVRPGLPSELLASRPDIIAAEHRLRAANANIGAARAAFFPRITLTGGLGTASAELDGLFRSGSRAWSFAPSISLPIFDAGRLRSSLDLAEVRQEIAVSEYEKTIQHAFREVADALAARHWLAEQVRVQQNARQAQAERARLAKLRYDNGAAPYLEVLDAERDLLSAQQLLVQARRAWLSSGVDLYVALGGGAVADQAPAQAEPTSTLP